MKSNLVIRPLAETDSLTELTNLLHRAYRPLAEMGLQYVASYQTEEVTRRRFGRGRGYVAHLDGTLAGTITLYPIATFSECLWYLRPDVWYFGQFAVDLPYQKQGIGAALMDFVEQAAQAEGAAELSLDTSEQAISLIAYYIQRGYRQVDTVQWPVTNYRSLVLSKTLSSDML